MWLMLTLETDNEQQKTKCLWAAVINNSPRLRAVLGSMGFLQELQYDRKISKFCSASPTRLVALQIPWVEEGNSPL